MSALGDNKSHVKNAKSTDLSSLLNVLEWMVDVAFGGCRRVQLNLVKDLRSKVRNAWAHASNQEMTEAVLKEAFEIANKFLADLDEVFPDEETKKCMKEIKLLQVNGLTNVTETDLKNLVLLRRELGGDVSQMKEEIRSLKQDQHSDTAVIRENEKKLKNLEDFSKKCCSRMEDFQKWKENLDKLFNDVKMELDSFREETRKDIGEIRADIKALQDAKNVCNTESLGQTSRLPERLSTFTGREKEIEAIKSSLVEKDCGIVSIIGGPGFGKSTIAVEVSHRLSEKHKIPVIFSYLSRASTVPEAVRLLCLDNGIEPAGDPESSLMVWLRNMKPGKVVLVLDNIEQLLEGEAKSDLFDLLRSLRKGSNQQLQIITTSRKSFRVSGLENECCLVEEMDTESSVELLRKCCPEQDLQCDALKEMTNLCGHVPLALRLLAFHLKDTDPAKLVEWLQDTPLEVLQTPDEKVTNAIEKSFEILQSEEKTHFVRLSVCEGNFNREAAQHVTGLKEIRTKNVLSELVERSLLQRSGGNYSIHPLIRSYLIGLEEFLHELKQAKELMVEHFLRVCHDLTLKYWSKDGSNFARKALKENLHHVENMLKICDEALKETNPISAIVNILVESQIYQSSSRFFYNFILHILSPTLVRKFLECCARLAVEKKKSEAKLNFECLLADEIGRRIGWESKEYKKSMELAKTTFDEIENNQKGNREIKSHFYYCYGRYQFNQRNASEAEEYLQKSLELRQSEQQTDLEKSETQTDLETVDQVVTLTLLGKVCQPGAKEDCCYKALRKSKEYLGDHELTLNCYKRLGDIKTDKKRNEEALEYYNKAEETRKVLGITDSSVSSVYFLKNRGTCFSNLGRHQEAVQVLKEACGIIETLPGDNIQCKLQVYFRVAKALNKQEFGCPEAKEYAKKALEVNKKLSSKRFLNGKKEMEAIIRQRNRKKSS